LGFVPVLPDLRREPESPRTVCAGSRKK